MGIILAVLAAGTTALQVRGLLRLGRWAQGAAARPLWLLAPGIAWKFVPVALLVGLQPLVGLLSGRVFSHHQLFLAMLEVVIWLGSSGLLGAITGMGRILILARR